MIPIDASHLVALIFAAARCNLYWLDSCFYDEHLVGYVVVLRHGADHLQQQTFTDYDDAVRWIEKLAAWHAPDERIAI